MESVMFNKVSYGSSAAIALVIRIALTDVDWSILRRLPRFSHEQLPALFREHAHEIVELVYEHPTR